MRGVQRVNSLLERSLGIRVQRVQNDRLFAHSTTPAVFNKPSQSLTGMVEHFDKKEVVGWVSGNSNDFPVKISVCVNDYPVLSTWADVDVSLNTTGTLKSFFIGTKGVWKYCKQSDRLTVRAADKTLPIGIHGTFLMPEEDGESSIDILNSKLASGYVFNRGGALQLSMKLDTNRQEQMLDLYKSTSKILEKKCDTTVFLIYGSLLGQVRESGFIGHDDDLDIAYVSRHRTGSEAVKEIIKIAHTLQDNGLIVELRATAAHIHSTKNPKLRIDLFYLYFNEKDELSFPFGVAGTKHFMRSDWHELTKGKFAGHSVVIPENAEKLVECIYGESWRTPIVGFNWNHARTRRDYESKIPVKVRAAFNKTD